MSHNRGYMKKQTRKVDIEYEYFVGDSRAQDGYFEGGVVIPPLESLKVWVDSSEVFDESIDSFVIKGNQINIVGDSQTLFEFGKLLIAISQFANGDQNYHEHLDELNTVGGHDRCDIIIRKE